MQNNKSSISKEIILETTLALINDNGGIKNVTLREIAKKLGCAHTNLYNYFSSLDEIFWEALAKVLVKMMDSATAELSAEADLEEKFHLFLSNIIDFSMDYPGWYRLVWLETLGGNPSSEVIKTLGEPGRRFNEVIINLSNEKLSEEKANLIGGILHSYMHGEICKWINNRSAADKEETKMNILLNLEYMYKLIAQSQQINLDKELPK